MSFQFVSTEPERDRWGRPLIIPPDGGKPVAYMRVTRFIDVIEDHYNLERWQERMTAIGLLSRPDLQLRASSLLDADTPGAKSELNSIIGEAKEAARAHERATIGTALHEYTRTLDSGGTITTVPPEWKAWLDTYRTVTRQANLQFHAAELFLVNDALQIAGTADRVVSIGDDPTLYIADLKTGSFLSPLKFAQQFAAYAGASLYDVTTGERTPLNVSQERALLIHAPADTDTTTCELSWVDLQPGREANLLASQIWQMRRTHATTRGGQALLTPLTGTDRPVSRPTIDEIEEHGWAQDIDEAIRTAIATATSEDMLTAIWQEAQAHGTWRDEHTQLAQRKLADLTTTN